MDLILHSATMSIHYYNSNVLCVYALQINRSSCSLSKKMICFYPNDLYHDYWSESFSPTWLLLGSASARLPLKNGKKIPKAEYMCFAHTLLVSENISPDPQLAYTDRAPLTTIAETFTHFA